MVPMLFESPNQASIEFAAVIADIAEELNTCIGEKHEKLEKIKLLCEYLTDTDNIPVLSPKEIEKLKASKSIFGIFSLIRPHCSWHSHHLLPVIINRIGSSTALEMLKKFKAKVRYDKKLREINEMFVRSKVPMSEEYCKMVGIVDRDYSEIVLEDCIKIDDYISEVLGPFQCIEWNKCHSVGFVWLIPKASVIALCQRASQIKDEIKTKLFIFFEIHKIIVFDDRSPIQVNFLCTLHKYGYVYMHNTT